MPASSAISRTVVAWKPLRAKSSAASLTRWSRRSDADPEVARCRFAGVAVVPEFFRVVTSTIMSPQTIACSHKSCSSYGVLAYTKRLLRFGDERGVHRRCRAGGHAAAPAGADRREVRPADHVRGRRAGA